MTRSSVLITQIREICHTERRESFEVSELQCLAMQLCEEYETAMAALLRLEATIHRLSKEAE